MNHVSSKKESHEVSPSGVALITGAGRGIGRATAHLFAKRGVSLVLVSRTATELEAVKQELREFESSGVSVHVFSCDVGDEKEIARLFSFLETNALEVSILINNAGVALRKLTEDMDASDWNRVLSVNLTAAFLLTKGVLSQMKKRKEGRIVNVASISATLGTPKLSAYCASKWGMLGFTKAVAEELRGSGVEILSVLPGSVDTDMLKGSGFEPAMTPEDVAKAIVYAALDAPSVMNGSSIEIFG